MTLTVGAHTHQFYPGVTTNTYGVNGPYLGPTMIFNHGEMTRILVENQLQEITTMHWHGMHVPGQMDGGPHNVIEPGDSWLAEYEVKNPAGTYWYHPHPHGMTAKQANFGIAGMIIVRDADEAQINLPRTYGIDDFPVVIQDRRFLSNGNFALYPYGDSLLVNGTPNPVLEVPAQVVRLRLLNGSNARVYNLGLDNGEDLPVIAGDGGLLAEPAYTDRLLLSNGERYEVLLNLAGLEGDTLTLMSYASELPETVPGGYNIMLESSHLNGIDFPVLRLAIGEATAEPVTAIPTSMIAHVAPNELAAERTRIKTLTGMGMVGNGAFRINGELFEMDVINDTIDLGATEVWHFVNNTNMAHPMHLHAVSFFVLERNGQAPPAWEQGPKDVVLVDIDEDVKFIMQFNDLSNDFPYMYHCHNLMHEDNMMMLQFAVVDRSVGVALTSEDRMLVGPSPTTGEVRFQASFAVERVVVRDALGRLLMDRPTPVAKEGRIDLVDAPSGVLVLELHGPQQRRVVRVVKQ